MNSTNVGIMVFAISGEGGTVVSDPCDVGASATR